MRREMDAAGFAATKLVLPDIAGELPVAILDMIESNADYSAAVDILGVHYCGDPKCAHSERVAALGKEIWMTEGSVDTSVGALRLELSRVPLLQDLETAKLEMPRGCVAAVARGQRREGEQHTHMQELA